MAKRDARTKEARLLRETRAALVAHVGGRPSAVQLALIERASQLTLRIAAMDRRFADLGEQTDHDSRTYLAWSNSLTRTLAQLGLVGAAPGEPTLAETIVAAHARPVIAALVAPWAFPAVTTAVATKIATVVPPLSLPLIVLLAVEATLVRWPRSGGSGGGCRSARCAAWTFRSTIRRPAPIPKTTSARRSARRLVAPGY